jgi:hypothetical protein
MERKSFLRSLAEPISVHAVQDGSFKKCLHAIWQL